MAGVLVRTRHGVPGQRPDVLPVPAAVCLRAAGGLPAAAALRSGRHGVRAVLLGLHHHVRGVPGGECRRDAPVQNVPLNAAILQQTYKDLTRKELLSFDALMVESCVSFIALQLFSSRRPSFWGR